MRKSEDANSPRRRTGGSGPDRRAGWWCYGANNREHGVRLARGASVMKVRYVLGLESGSSRFHRALLPAN